MTELLTALRAFEDYPILTRQTGGNSVPGLSIRYVSIIRDLAMIYQWLQDSRLCTNYRPAEKEKRMIRHFRQSLESTDRQPFLIEFGSVPVYLFELALISTHELYYRLPTRSGDCILYYLFPDNSQAHDLFESALTLQLNYFFSFPEHRKIWVCIPVHQLACQALFLDCGFVFKTEYYSLQQRFGIFFLKRSDYNTWTVTSN